MKKIHSMARPLPKSALIKYLIAMKLLVFLILGLSLQALATKTYSQDKLNLDINNVSIAKAFKAIEAKSAYRFVYNQSIVENSLKVSIKAKEATLEDVMNQLLEGTGFIYKTISGNLISVTTENQAVFAPVTGIVTDSTNRPIPGATVTVKGTKIATQTDGQGRYTINAKDGDVLVFSILGFNTAEKTVNGKVVDVSLTTSSQNLNEVVVTALGIVKSKKNLSYATQSVSVDEFSKARELNVANSLSGKVAGLDIVRSSSGLGGSTRINLRGDRSIAGNNQALIVVDGIPIDNGAGSGAMASGGRDAGDGISSINPDDIESLNVLKGATATALYGSRAANGAILITTKKGTEGKGLGVSYTASYQMETPMYLYKFQNEYGQGSKGIYSASSETSWGPRFDGSQVATWSKQPYDAGKTYAYEAQPDNFKDFYTTGGNLVNGIALNGGTGKTQAYFSYTNTHASGIVENNKLNRHNVNFRLGSQFGKKLTLDAKITYLNEVIDNRLKTGETLDNPNSHIYRVPRNIRTADLEDYEYFTSSGFARQNYWLPTGNTSANPYWVMNRNLATDERNRVTGFASLTYEILSGFKFMMRSGLDRYVDDVEQKWYVDTYIRLPQGGYQVDGRTVLETNNDFLFSLDKKLSSDFSINANFGGNIQKNKLVTNSSFTGPLLVENLFYLGNASSLSSTRGVSEREKQSLYATTDIGFKDYLTLTLTGRNDWSSTLPKENRSYQYGAAGLSLIVSDLFKMPSFVNFAKLRGSIAQTGNDAPPYIGGQTYSLQPGGNGAMVFRDDLKPIDNLKPEITTAQEAGLEFRLFGGKIGGDIAIYRSISKNQLIQRTLPAASGWTRQFVNAGKVKNTGIEVTLNGTPIKSNNFKWDLAVNYAKNNNEVLEIAPDLPELITGTDGYMNVVKLSVGRPFGELYSRGYVRDANGKVVVDANGLPTVSAAQNVYVGNTRANWTGSVINKFSYNNFYASFVISGRIGGVVSSLTNAITYGVGVSDATLAGRDGFVFDGVFADGTPNTKTITAEQYWTKVGGRGAPAGEVFTYSATNIRMREVVLGYQIPKTMFKNLPFQSANISLTGRNLFFFVNRAGDFDPELTTGSSDNSVGIASFSPPTTRTFGINLNLTF